jgi:uncharacterized protein YjeT (DUF2065 family)
MGEVIVAGIALMFVFEGILPFVTPRLWRETFRKALELTDGQLRTLGLVSMVAGLAILAIVRAMRSSP